MNWINCKNRMPENEEECLVAFSIMPGDPGCGVCFNMATYINGVFLSWELGNLIDNVTYWMPLPEFEEEG